MCSVEVKPPSWSLVPREGFQKGVGPQSCDCIIDPVALAAAGFHAWFCHLHFTQEWWCVCVNVNTVLYVGKDVYFKMSYKLSTHLSAPRAQL